MVPVIQSSSSRSGPEAVRVFQRGAVPSALLKRASVDRMLRAAAEDWCVVLLAWTAMTFTSGWLYPLWCMVVASRLHSLGVILHDATHLPAGPKTWNLRLLELLVGFPIGSTIQAMRYHHLRHHRHNGTRFDPYFKRVRGRPVMYFLLWLRGWGLLPFWTARGFYGAVAYHVPALRQSYARVFLQDRSSADLRNHPEVIHCAREEHGQAVVHALAMVALVLWPEAVIFYFLIPVSVTGLLASYRVLAEHNHLPATDHAADTVVAITQDHNLRGLGSFLFAPRHIGHHIVHHLHPQVASEHLPQLRAWYVAHHQGAYPAPLGAQRERCA